MSQQKNRNVKTVLQVTNTLTHSHSLYSLNKCISIGKAM